MGLTIFGTAIAVVVFTLAVCLVLKIVQREFGAASLAFVLLVLLIAGSLAVLWNAPLQSAGTLISQYSNTN